MRVSRTFSALIGVGLVVGSLLPGQQARAQKRAVLLSIAGSGGERIHESIRGSLGREPRVQMVDSDELLTMASEFGIDPARIFLDPTLLSQAASASQVDAVVIGQVSGRGRRTRLSLEIYDGGTGNQLRRLDVRLGRGQLRGKELHRVVCRLITAIEGGSWMGPLPPELPPMPGDEPGPGAAPPPRSYRPEPAWSPEPPPAQEPQEPDYEEPSYEADYRSPAAEPVKEPYAPRVEALVDPQADPYEEPGLPPEERFEPEPLGEPHYGYEEEPLHTGMSARRGRGPGNLSMAMGLTGLSRTFELEDVRLADGRPGTVSYDSGFFPGLVGEASFYPLAIARQKGWAAGIGLEVSFEYGFLKSQIQEQVSNQGATELINRVEETSQYQVAASLAYRMLPFTLGPGSAVLKLLLGLGLSSFGLAQGTPGYKSNETIGLRVGTLFELPLFTIGLVVISADIRGSYLVGSTSLNEKKVYPASSARGYELGAGLRLDYRSFLVRAVDLYSVTTTSFDATASDPAASCQDRYQGFVILLGYRS